MKKTLINKSNSFSEGDNFSETETTSRHIWTTIEDNLLKTSVQNQFELNPKAKKVNWKVISDIFSKMHIQKMIPYLRSGKQCRERWRNHVGVDTKKWNSEIDDEKLFKLNCEYSNKWTTISNLMGKTENEVKNRFHISMRKKVTEICDRLESIQQSKIVYSIIIKEKIPYLKVDDDIIYSILSKNKLKTEKKKYLSRKKSQTETVVSFKVMNQNPEKSIRNRRNEINEYVFITKFKEFCYDFMKLNDVEY